MDFKTTFIRKQNKNNMKTHPHSHNNKNQINIHFKYAKCVLGRDMMTYKFTFIWMCITHLRIK